MLAATIRSIGAMKSTWGIALGCAAIALVLVWRMQRPNSASDVQSPAHVSHATGSDLRTFEQRGAAGAPHAAGGPETSQGARPEAASGATRPGDTTGTDRSAQIRSRLPPRSAAPQGGAAAVEPGGFGEPPGAARGQIADAEGPAAAKRALPDGGAHGRDLGSGGHDVQPVEGGAAEPAADDADNKVPPALPEVAYDGAERIFDTASRTEVTDAGEINDKAGTVSFWFQPEWQHNNQDNAGFVQLGDSGLQIIKEGNYLRFQYTDGTGGGAVDISNWDAGGWRQVTATWVDATLSLFVDGEPVFVNHASAPPDFRGTAPKLYVGSGFPNAVALGQLSNLTVLNRGASNDEVKQMFQSGPPAE